MKIRAEGEAWPKGLVLFEQNRQVSGIFYVWGFDPNGNALAVGVRWNRPNGLWPKWRFGDGW